MAARCLLKDLGEHTDNTQQTWHRQICNVILYWSSWVSPSLSNTTQWVDVLKIYSQSSTESIVPYLLQKFSVLMLLVLQFAKLLWEHQFHLLAFFHLHIHTHIETQKGKAQMLNFVASSLAGSVILSNPLVKWLEKTSEKQSRVFWNIFTYFQGTWKQHL